MTKGKLLSSKKSDKIDVEKIVTFGLEKLSEWTRKELEELQRTSKSPICIQLANGDYIVGTYKVKKISTVCWNVEGIEFADKRSAIFYCALTHLGKYADANELRDVDWHVGKLDYDKALFRVRLDEAHLLGDQFKIDLYSSRFEDAKSRLAQAKRELEKIISRAKYYKTLGT